MICPIITFENNIKLDTHTQVEFDDWALVDYWRPIEGVTNFKNNL